MTKINHRMRQLLGAHADDPRTFGSAAPAELLGDLDEGFEVVSGCLLPRGWVDEIVLDEHEDETYVECQVSKVNFRDCVSPGDSYESMLRMAVAYAYELKRGLQQSGASGPFRIILGADSEGEYPSVAVRYHKIRPGQDWLGSDLEGYADGALVLDF